MNPNPSDPSAEQQTLLQGDDGLATAKRLSMQATMPPAEVPGVRIERFLGAGAFGQVWVGRDLNTGRPVAVKYYLHRTGVNWSLLSREVKNLVQLSADRHVVQVLEVGWDADPPYYIMELIEGGSLEDLLVRRGRLPIDEAVHLFRMICTGLLHCHSRGVLHCDLKPANILLGPDGEPRLADFGQSRMSHDQTPAMGTLFYMAPEQADLTATPDARWDVYAAGAILYRMLSGTAPHRERSLLSQLDTAGSLPGRLSRYREAIASAGDPVSKLERPIDRSLKSILQRCLSTDPTARFSNVQLILDELNQRDRLRARRPLMLLGIVGPLLVLLATSVFARRGIDRATYSATVALRREAFGANQLAARFAAKTLESEIQDYFDLLESEANREEFQRRLSAVLDDESVITSLRAIGAADSPAATRAGGPDRDRVIDSSTQDGLQRYLDTRLQLHDGRAADISRSNQSLATIFVTDRLGTIISIAYQDPVARDQNSIGRNFAYRTYFHGERDDLNATIPIGQAQPLQRTHLSSAFQSTATGLWKVAISTPVKLHDQDEDGALVDRDAASVDAVLVATVNLGDFQVLQQRKADGNESPQQVAVLVDARPGEVRGTVLQHPLMQTPAAADRDGGKVRYQVPGDALDRLLDGGDVFYEDPMREAVGGQKFAGQWLAAMEPVALPERLEKDIPVATVGAGKEEEEDQRTDLMVLVQYRLAQALGPVGDLRRSLIRELTWAMLSILIVTVSLWWVVRKVNSKANDTDQPVDSPEASLEETMPVS
ncbi:MAG: protein kinase [Planctomycetota bacterium]